MDLAEMIFEEASTAIERLTELPGDIYALSFFVHDEDDDPRRPTVTVGYNTTDHWREVVATASSEAEAKWNFAFWPQNEIASFGRDGTPSQELVTAWLKDIGLYYTDEQADADFDATLALDKGITEQFVAACCSAARQLHSQGIVSRSISAEVPVIVHGLEYYDAVADQNEHCNPRGVADEFIRWIREDACR